MQKLITKLSESTILKSYPRKLSVEGWYYNIKETSNCVWLVECSDLWGRKVSQQGTDIEELIDKLTLDIKELCKVQ